MTTGNARYEVEKERLAKIVAAWEPRFDLPGVVVHHGFVETFREGENEHWTSAYTETDWHYRQARVLWYLPTMCRLTDEDLEEMVVHEYVHVLNAVLESRAKPNSDDYLEHAAQNVTRALLATYRSKR